MVAQSDISELGMLRQEEPGLWAPVSKHNRLKLAKISERQEESLQ